MDRLSIDLSLERIKEGVQTRRDSRRADDDDWVTVKGTHVLLGEGGVAQSGGKLKGMTFSKAKSSGTGSKKGSGAKADPDDASSAKKTLDDYEDVAYDLLGLKPGSKEYEATYKKADKIMEQLLSQKDTAQDAAIRLSDSIATMYDNGAAYESPEVQRALSLLEKYGYSDFADYTREWDW